MSIAPGIYPAKISGEYGIGESALKKTLFVAVNIKVQDAEKRVHVLQYNGWLSEKAIESTNKALAVMGMAIPDYEALTDGKGLDVNKQFYVTIEDELSQDGTKSYPKIKWINEGPGGGKVNLLDKSSAINRLKGLGLISGAVKSTMPTFTDDDIPF